jgi:hypothetical protein
MSRIAKVDKSPCLNKIFFAPLAQLVEQATLNRQVIGSNPMRCILIAIKNQVSKLKYTSELFLSFDF